MIDQFRRAPWWVWVIICVGITLAIIASATSSESDEDEEAVGQQGTSTVRPEGPSSNSESTSQSATASPTQVPPAATPVPPAPISLSGVGQLVTEPFNLPSIISRVTFTHGGSSNFIVKAYSDSGEDLLVNAIGSYTGTRPLIGEGQWFLEIDADGGWAATVEAIGTDPSAAQGFSGSGDAVSGLFDPDSTGAVPFEISNVGDANFVVWLHCGSGSELVQNEIGSVQGSTVVDFDDGPCFWEVESDGSWSLRQR